MADDAVKFTFGVQKGATNDSYEITVSSEFGQSWKVTRSVSVCSGFLAGIDALFPGTELHKPNLEPTNFPQRLNAFLEQLSSLTNGHLWKYPSIALFLEDTPLQSSSLAALQIRSLENKIEQLENHISEYGHRLHSIETTATALVETLRSLAPHNLSELLAAHGNISNNINNGGSNNNNNNNNNSNAIPTQFQEPDGLDALQDDSPRWSALNAETGVLSAPPGFYRPAISPRNHNNNDDESSTTESTPEQNMSHDAFYHRAGPNSGLGSSYSQQAQLPLAGGLDLRPAPSEYLDRDRFVAWEPLEAAGWDGTAGNISDSSRGPSQGFASHESPQQLQQDEWLGSPRTVDQLPVQDKYNWPIGCDDDVDNLISLLAPHEAQISFRETVFLLVQQQIRLALGAVCFDASMLQTRSFLPSDPLRITLALSQGQVAYWHSTLVDRLRAIADNGPDIDFSSPYAMNNVDVIDDLHRSLLQKLTNVQLLHEINGFRIVCRVVELDVEITANSRADMCLLAFLDEMNVIVSRDLLFKRSLLLIRGWWMHETQGLVTNPVAHFLSDSALNIMVAAVFNIYWQEIRSPLYALFYFLKLYEGYDGRSMAITVQGLVSFAADAPNQPSLMKPQPNHLIQLDMLCRYWQLFNVHDPLNSSDVAGVSGGAQGAIAGTAVSAALSAGQLMSATRGQPISKVKLHMLYNSMAKSLQRFERFSFNILHPFNHNNLITEKISSRRTALLTQVFKAGFSGLNIALQRMRVEPSSQIRSSVLSNLFSIFGGAWRPDAHGSSISSGLVDLKSNKYGLEPSVSASMSGLHDQLWQAIDYCSFVVESVISESAILTFCMDILTWRGPLPTGEVGKLLSEATTIPNLSHKLRERFGGLKKFLERYPDVFVFSNDHPFNPHVLLRRTLSEENLALIDRGIFPVHLISKTARQPPQKKNPAVPPTGYQVTGGGPTGSVGGGGGGGGLISGNRGPTGSQLGGPAVGGFNGPGGGGSGGGAGDYYGASGYSGGRQQAGVGAAGGGQAAGGMHGRSMGPPSQPMGGYGAGGGGNGGAGRNPQGINPRAGGPGPIYSREAAMVDTGRGGAKFNPSSDPNLNFFASGNTPSRGSGGGSGTGGSFYGQGSQNSSNNLRGTAAEFYPDSLGGGGGGGSSYGFGDRGQRSTNFGQPSFEDFDLGPAPQRGGGSSSFRGSSGNSGIAGGGSSSSSGYNNVFDINSPSGGFSAFGSSPSGLGGSGFSGPGSSGNGVNNNPYSGSGSRY